MWDMPTGILRDIWIALSSLGDYQTPKLEKLWVRLHDNRAALLEAEITSTSTAPPPAQAPPGQGTVLAPTQGTPYQSSDFEGAPRIMFTKTHREEPNFSIMPPLRSLTVLDIDEITYLEELSVLLERSLDKLRELRIGFAEVLCSSCNNRDQSNLKYLAKGGPLPLLMSKIYDYMGDINRMTMPPEFNTEGGASMKPSDNVANQDTASLSLMFPPSVPSPDMNEAKVKPQAPNDVHHATDSGVTGSKAFALSLDAIDPALYDEGAPTEGREIPEPHSKPEADPFQVLQDSVDRHRFSTNMKANNDENVIIWRKEPQIGPSSLEALQNLLKPTQRLKLETLEIEMVSLHVTTLYKTIDWTILTSLTLLKCGNTESLWSCLQEKFPPRKTLVVSIPTQPTQKRGSQPRLRRMPSSEALSKTSEYPLSLKRIHTDHVSPALVSFLKHGLAPNSLEWLFLQDTNVYGSSSVTLDAIYRGPLRRHRSSLAKIMIDSASGSQRGRTRGVTARKWMLTREVLTFISSGKITRLRELAMTVQYKDWHFFLQRLPQIPHLRSLYVPYIADHPYGGSLNVRDFAMSAINVVALRPEVELTYVGIKDKCFEILETKPKSNKDGAGEMTDDEDDDAEVSHGHNSDDSDNDDEDDDTEDEDAAPVTAATQAQGTDSDVDPLTDEESDPVGGPKVKLKLREILFYEDRISIFKARHGRL